MKIERTSSTTMDRIVAFIENVPERRLSLSDLLAFKPKDYRYDIFVYVNSYGFREDGTVSTNGGYNGYNGWLVGAVHGVKKGTSGPIPLWDEGDDTEYISVKTEDKPVVAWLHILEDGTYVLHETDEETIKRLSSQIEEDLFLNSRIDQRS